MTVHARDKGFERDRSATERVIHHLARHGIAARVDQRRKCDNAISDILLSRAMDFYDGPVIFSPAAAGFCLERRGGA